MSAKAVRPAPAETGCEPRAIDQAAEPIKPTHIRDATTLQAPIIIVIAPAKRVGYFCATLDGRVIVGASRQPLLDAARVLLAAYVDPRAVLVCAMPAPMRIACELKSGVAAAARSPLQKAIATRPTSDAGSPCSPGRDQQGSRQARGRYPNMTSRCIASGGRRCAGVCATDHERDSPRWRMSRRRSSPA